jgi:hypothetical protein
MGCISSSDPNLVTTLRTRALLSGWRTYGYRFCYERFPSRLYRYKSNIHSIATSQRLFFCVVFQSTRILGVHEKLKIWFRKQCSKNRMRSQTQTSFSFARVLDPFASRIGCVATQARRRSIVLVKGGCWERNLLFPSAVTRLT